MPSEQAHIDLARHNQLLIDHLLPEIHRFSDWVTTVAFYKALHIVEAVFAANGPRRHGGSHPDREQLLKGNRQYSNIWKHYRPLWAASTIARYLEYQGSQYASFTAYMDHRRVQSEIINHRLRQVETSAQHFLSLPIAAPPPSPPPSPPGGAKPVP
jgi:hypothetical protein